MTTTSRERRTWRFQILVLIVLGWFAMPYASQDSANEGFILFSTVGGKFMHAFGADSLYLAPEYLGNVNSISMAIVGMSVGMFIMSWNISTFILFSRHFQFLAATTNPFLKYCLNNAIIPIIFLRNSKNHLF